jgi:hypothetical protein
MSESKELYLFAKSLWDFVSADLAGKHRKLDWKARGLRKQIAKLDYEISEVQKQIASAR